MHKKTAVLAVFLYKNNIEIYQKGEYNIIQIDFFGI